MIKLITYNAAAILVVFGGIVLIVSLILGLISIILGEGLETYVVESKQLIRHYIKASNILIRRV